MKNNLKNNFRIIRFIRNQSLISYKTNNATIIQENRCKKIYDTCIVTCKIIHDYV